MGRSKALARQRGTWDQGKRHGRGMWGGVAGKGRGIEGLGWRQSGDVWGRLEVWGWQGQLGRGHHLNVGHHFSVPPRR